MTISAYTGLPGHGKSYGVVENVIAVALENKRRVFTNIPMHDEECEKRFNQKVIQFNTQDILDNPDWWEEVFIAGSIIVIDELWRLWPAGLNAKNVRQQDKSFLAEHRHLVGECGNSTEIIFVTQDLSQIASFARSLVETTYRVTKLSNVGANSRYRLDVYFGAVTGTTPPKSKKQGESYGKFHKKTYQLYQSHTKSKIESAGNEDRVDKRFNILSPKTLVAFISCLILLITIAFLGLSSVTGFYGTTDSDQEAKVDTKTPKSKPVKTKKNPVFNFLSKAESIEITFNNGSWPNIEYRYRVEFEGRYTDMSYQDFQRLGYQLTPINKCLVKIKGDDFNGVALCSKDEKTESWFNEALPSTSLAAN